jgi:nicotinamidase/pyrazinamidase
LFHLKKSDTLDLISGNEFSPFGRREEPMIDPKSVLKKGDGLLVVDVQRCFCPGGELPVAGGDEIVPTLNRWIQAAREQGVPVYFSRDWHSPQHVSFENQGGPWPPHCVQDTEGAEFHPDLIVPEESVIVTKGVRLDQDQNSAFDQTGLAVRLEKDGIKRLFVGGLAQDVCVLATVLDATFAGFETVLIKDATRPVTPEGGQEALERMEQAGVLFLSREGELKESQPA